MPVRVRIRISLRELALDRFQFRPCLLDSCAVPEPPQHPKGMRHAIVHLPLCKRAGRKPYLTSLRKLKSWRKNSHQRETLSVQFKSSADCFRVCAEGPSPQPIAPHKGVSSIRLLFLRSKPASQDRLMAQHGEKSMRYDGGPNPFR